MPSALRFFIPRSIAPCAVRYCDAVVVLLARLTRFSQSKKSSELAVLFFRCFLFCSFGICSRCCTEHKKVRCYATEERSLVVLYLNSDIKLLLAEKRFFVYLIDPDV